MAINWGLMDTQYPARLASLLSPEEIRARQAQLQNAEQANLAQQISMANAVEQIKNAPVARQRAEAEYQYQQQQRAAAEAERIRQQQQQEQLMGQLDPQQRQLIQLGVPAEKVLIQKPLEAPKTRSYKMGQATITEEWDANAGRWRKIAQGMPSPTSKGQMPMSPTAQKELFEADEFVQSGKNAVGLLQEALNLNKQAYSGAFAKERAVVRSQFGEDPKATATINLDNIMTSQALESLKSIFGGMPTEGERKILLDIQASADKTPTQREQIIKRAIDAANKRIEFNRKKAESLRSGTYFSEGVPADTQQEDDITDLLNKYQ